MSNEDEQKDAEFPDEDELIVNEVADEPASLPAPETAVAEKKGSGGIAWLALFLALISAAGIGYMLYQDWRAGNAADESANSLAERRNRLASSSESLSRLDRGLADCTVWGEAYRNASLGHKGAVDAGDVTVLAIR